MGQWVMGHSQWPIDPWRKWNNCAVACNFKYTTYSNTLHRTLFLVDIKKLLTHSIRPIMIAGGLILIYDFLFSRPRGLSSTTMPRPLLVPCVGWNVMAMGHGSRNMTHFHLCYKDHEMKMTNKRTVKRLDPDRKGEISAFLNDA